MSLVVNLRHLEVRNLASDGELNADKLDIDTRDEMVRVASPLAYELEVQKLEKSLLVRGWLRLTLDCQCVRCLMPFQRELEIEDWTCDVPLAGEESAPVVSDCVDLTPYAREDILLTFPQHPLCKPDCRGLKNTNENKTKISSAVPAETKSSAWAALDKLKF